MNHRERDRKERRKIGKGDGWRPTRGSRTDRASAKDLSVWSAEPRLCRAAMRFGFTLKK